MKILRRRLRRMASLPGILSVVFVAACGAREGRIARELKSRAPGGNAEIRLADVALFAWDRLCLFGPYTSRSEAEACLGFPWPEFHRTGIDRADTFHLLVFASSSRVVHVERVSRDLDFANEILKRPFSRADAIFAVRLSSRGRRELWAAAGKEAR